MAQIMILGLKCMLALGVGYIVRRKKRTVNDNDE